MSRPTHFLRHEHRVIEQGLRALEGLCSRLKLGEQIPHDAIARALDFIRVYADQLHHGKEEDYLFPALRRSGMQFEEGSLEFLSREHDTERQLLAALGVEFEAYRNGNADALHLFIGTAGEYINHLIGHMRREDAILFRLVEEILDDADKDSLSHNFSQANASLGEGAVEFYEQTATELENAWSV